MASQLTDRYGRRIAAGLVRRPLKLLHRRVCDPSRIDLQRLAIAAVETFDKVLGCEYPAIGAYDGDGFGAPARATCVVSRDDPSPRKHFAPIVIQGEAGTPAVACFTSDGKTLRRIRAR